MPTKRRTGETVSILGFTPPTQKDMERSAAEHLVDVKTRAHPTVKKIRNAIMDQVLKAGTTVSKPAAKRG